MDRHVNVGPFFFLDFFGFAKCAHFQRNSQIMALEGIFFLKKSLFEVLQNQKRVLPLHPLSGSTPVNEVCGTEGDEKI